RCRRDRRADCVVAVGGPDHGGGAGLRERPCGRFRGLARELPAERVQAGHPAQRPRVDSIAGGGRALVQRPLRRRHRPEREAHPRAPGEFADAGHGAQPAHRLREVGADLLKAYRDDLTMRDAALQLGFITAEEFDEWVRPADVTTRSRWRRRFEDDDQSRRRGPDGLFIGGSGLSPVHEPARGTPHDGNRISSTLTAAVPRPFDWIRVLMPPLMVAGCAPWDRPLPIPPEVTQAGAAARVVVPPDLGVDISKDVVERGTPGAEPAQQLPGHDPQSERTTFALSDAIAFALRNSPRLRSARAAIERARGQELVAFAPFLPQIDLFGQYGVVSDTLNPGVPGYTGSLRAGDPGTRDYAQTELGLQWILYDFGRTGGRYRQAVARGGIAELQLLRADQTVEFDVATAYVDVLLARAFHRVQVDAVREAEAILDDTVA